MSVQGANARLNINPGDYYFGGEYPQIFTLLGSCIAVTCWHPRFRIGGVCHYVIPYVPKEKLPLAAGEIGRYGESALTYLHTAMQYYGSVQRFQLGVYGGSDTLLQFSVGQRNIEVVKNWVDNLNIKPRVWDVGGHCSRALLFSLASGLVEIKRLAIDEG